MARIKALEVEAMAALKGAVADGFRGVGAVMGRLVRVERLFWRLHARNARVERKRAMLADGEARAGVREALGGLEALRAWEDRARALEAAEADEVLAAGREAVAGDADAPVSASGEVPEWYLRMRGEEALAGGVGGAGAIESHDVEGCRFPGLEPGARSPCKKRREVRELWPRSPRPRLKAGEAGRVSDELRSAWRLPRLKRQRGARRTRAAIAKRAERRGRQRGEPRIAVWPCELMTRAERRGRGVSFRVRVEDRMPVVVDGLVMRPVELPYPDF